MDSLGFSVYEIMSSADTSSLISFFPVQLTFIYFSCLITLAKTYSTVLNRNSERGHGSLDPDLMGKAFSLLPLSMMLTVGFS